MKDHIYSLSLSFAAVAAGASMLVLGAPELGATITAGVCSVALLTNGFAAKSFGVDFKVGSFFAGLGISAGLLLATAGVYDGKVDHVSVEMPVAIVEIPDVGAHHAAVAGPERSPPHVAGRLILSSSP